MFAKLNIPSPDPRPKWGAIFLALILVAFVFVYRGCDKGPSMGKLMPADPNKEFIEVSPDANPDAFDEDPNFQAYIQLANGVSDVWYLSDSDHEVFIDLVNNLWSILQLSGQISDFEFNKKVIDHASSVRDISIDYPGAVLAYYDFEEILRIIYLEVKNNSKAPKDNEGEGVDNLESNRLRLSS